MIKDIQFYRKDGRIRLQKLVGDSLGDIWVDVETKDEGVEKRESFPPTEE